MPILKEETLLPLGDLLLLTVTHLNLVRSTKVTPQRSNESLSSP